MLIHFRTGKLGPSPDATGIDCKSALRRDLYRCVNEIGYRRYHLTHDRIMFPDSGAP
jgi:hypothetical protein